MWNDVQNFHLSNFSSISLTHLISELRFQLQTKLNLNWNQIKVRSTKLQADSPSFQESWSQLQSFQIAGDQGMAFWFQILHWVFHRVLMIISLQQNSNEWTLVLLTRISNGVCARSYSQQPGIRSERLVSAFQSMKRCEIYCSVC